MFNDFGTIFFTFFILGFIIEQVLIIFNLNFTKNKTNKIPEAFADEIDQDKYNKSIKYTIDKGNFEIISNIFSFIYLFLLIFGKGFNKFDIFARKISPTNEYYAGLIFVCIIYFVMFILNLPFEIYQDFKIESKYGFNKITPKIFMIDKLKSILITLTLTTPLLIGILYFMKKTGNFWWIWVFLFITFFQLFITIIYPVLIAPIFNKFIPLKNEELRTKLETLTKTINFPNSGIYQMDGSKRSSHSNAYFTGIGKTKRIVLFDTLMEKLTIPQILAVMAHEIGHYKKNHIKKNLLFTSLIFFSSLYLMKILMNWNQFYTGFGFEFSSNYAALTIFTISISVFSYIFTPLFSVLSRYFEYQADKFAVNVLGNSFDLKKALINLAKENLSNLTPHPLYSFFHYSHPPVIERIKALDKISNN